MSELNKFPCPVCGTRYLEEEFGSYEICPVCGWEEDGIQQKYPDEPGINGKWTLNAAKIAWESGKPLFDGYPNPNAK
ncbi:MAG: CPCC family cysteine-rich protein [Firmicutes bacterium]|nr:CPCC family cysteine-rich protein [Bacillota bacterium]